MPSPENDTATSLGRVSVVMMARAASAPPVRERASQAAGTPVSNVGMSNWTPITPVDATMTSLAGQPTCSPTISVVFWALRRPTSPVAALAQPEFTMRARAHPYDTPSRWSRETMTGAAQNTFWVNVAAHDAGSSATMRAMSSLSGSARKPAWMPAAAKPCALVTPPPEMTVRPSISGMPPVSPRGLTICVSSFCTSAIAFSI